MPLEKLPIHPYFGLKVAWWRQQKRMGVRALAAAAGVSPSLVSAYESLKANPSYPSACKVAKALDIHVQLLWDHTPPPHYTAPSSPRPVLRPRK